MAWRIVKQPNGMFARFSEVVDNFTAANMTRTEAYELCRLQMGIEDAERKVNAADLEPGRWDEALRIVELIHGKHELAALLAEINSEAKP